MDDVGIVVEDIDAAAGSSSPGSSRRPWSPITAAPVNALGYLRVLCIVEDVDDVVACVGKRGAKLAGEVAGLKAGPGSARDRGSSRSR